MITTTTAPRTLMYYYSFEGIDNPLIIEAQNREQADMLLGLFMEQKPAYQNRLINGVKCAEPVTGVTEKAQNGKIFVWVGFKRTHNGWMEKQEYENGRG